MGGNHSALLDNHDNCLSALTKTNELAEDQGRIALSLVENSIETEELFKGGGKGNRHNECSPLGITNLTTLFESFINTDLTNFDILGDETVATIIYFISGAQQIIEMMNKYIKKPGERGVYLESLKKLEDELKSVFASDPSKQEIFYETCQNMSKGLLEMARGLSTIEKSPAALEKTQSELYKVGHEIFVNFKRDLYDRLGVYKTKPKRGVEVSNKRLITEDVSQSFSNIGQITDLLNRLQPDAVECFSQRNLLYIKVKGKIKAKETLVTLRKFRIYGQVMEEGSFPFILESTRSLKLNTDIRNFRDATRVASMDTLTFGSRYPQNNIIPNIKGTLRKLVVEKYNNVLKLHYLHKLEELQLGLDFTGTVEFTCTGKAECVQSSGLRNLTILGQIDGQQPFDLSKLNQLQFLVIGDRWREKPIILPPNLETLVLGNNFNALLQTGWQTGSDSINLAYMMKLTTLLIGSAFQKNIVVFPPNLQILSLGDSYNHVIAIIPKSLQDLQLGRSFRQPILFVPDSLTKLKLPLGYPEKYRQGVRFLLSAKDFVDPQQRYLWLKNKIREQVSKYVSTPEKDKRKAILEVICSLFNWVRNIRASTKPDGSALILTFSGPFYVGVLESLALEPSSGSKRPLGALPQRDLNPEKSRDQTTNSTATESWPKKPKKQNSLAFLLKNPAKSNYRPKATEFAQAYEREKTSVVFERPNPCERRPPVSTATGSLRAGVGEEPISEQRLTRAEFVDIVFKERTRDEDTESEIFNQIVKPFYKDITVSPVNPKSYGLNINQAENFMLFWGDMVSSPGADPLRYTFRKDLTWTNVPLYIVLEGESFLKSLPENTVRCTCNGAHVPELNEKLSSLFIGDNFNGQLVLNKKLQKLVTGKKFNSTIQYNQELRHLYLGDSYNLSFKQPLPDSIVTLVIGNSFNSALLPHLPNLETFQVGNGFNALIEVNTFAACHNLRHLNFGDSFNQPLKLVLHRNARPSLILGDGFNSPIFAEKYRFIQIGNTYNTSFTFLENFNYLEELIIGDKFNQTINKVPNSLIRLEIGSAFRKALPPLSEHQKVSVLLGDDYDLSLPNGYIDLRKKSLDPKDTLLRQIITVREIPGIENARYYKNIGENIVSSDTFLASPLREPLTDDSAILSKKETLCMYIRVSKSILSTNVIKFNNLSINVPVILDLRDLTSQSHKQPFPLHKKVTFLYTNIITEGYENIIFLSFGNSYTQKLFMPPNLQYLLFEKVGKNLPDTFPETLRYLKVADDFEGRIGDLSRTKLEYLLLGKSFDKVIPNIPTSIKCIVIDISQLHLYKQEYHLKPETLYIRLPTGDTVKYDPTIIQTDQTEIHATTTETQTASTKPQAPQPQPGSATRAVDETGARGNPAKHLEAPALNVGGPKTGQPPTVNVLPGQADKGKEQAKPVALRQEDRVMLHPVEVRKESDTNISRPSLQAAPTAEAIASTSLMKNIQRDLKHLNSLDGISLFLADGFFLTLTLYKPLSQDILDLFSRQNAKKYLDENKESDAFLSELERVQSNITAFPYVIGCSDYGKNRELEAIPLPISILSHSKFHLILNIRCNFQPVRVPDSTFELNFDDTYTSQIPDLVQNTELRILKIGLQGDSLSSTGFNHSLAGRLPLGLRQLLIGNSFNQTLVGLPPRLQILVIGHSFNQNIIEELHLLSELQVLILGDSFNQSLHRLPAQLHYVSLGHSFNHNFYFGLDRQTGKKISRYLAIGGSYAQPFFLYKVEQSIANTSIIPHLPSLDPRSILLFAGNYQRDINLGGNTILLLSTGVCVKPLLKPPINKTYTIDSWSANTGDLDVRNSAAKAPPHESGCLFLDGVAQSYRFPIKDERNKDSFYGRKKGFLEFTRSFESSWSTKYNYSMAAHSVTFDSRRNPCFPEILYRFPQFVDTLIIKRQSFDTRVSSSITNLIIDSRNQAINLPFESMSSLQRLEIVNCPALSSLNTPPNLRELVLHYQIPSIYITNKLVLEKLQLVGSSKWPWPTFQPFDQLTSIVLGDDVDQPITDLPGKITMLSIGDSYSHPLPVLPDTLRYLSVGNLFNHPLGRLPLSLEELRLGDAYDQDFSAVVPQVHIQEYTLPRYILNLGKKFNKSLLPLFPANLKASFPNFEYPLLISVSNPNYAFPESIPSLSERMDNTSLQYISARFPLLKISEKLIENGKVLIIKCSCNVPWFLLGQILSNRYPEWLGQGHNRDPALKYLVIYLTDGIMPPNDVLPQVLSHPFFSKILYLILGGPYKFSTYPFLHRVSVDNLLVHNEHRDKILGKDFKMQTSTRVIYFAECVACQELSLACFMCPQQKKSINEPTIPNARHFFCQTCTRLWIETSESKGLEYIECPHCRTQVARGTEHKPKKSIYKTTEVPNFITRLFDEGD